MSGDTERRPLEGVSILVIDDDGELREALRRILEHAGCIVLDACSPAEAVNASRAYEGPLDIALIDVLMPEMSGPECADALLLDRPELAVGFMSGYYADTSGPPEPAVETAARAPFHIHKPFLSDELVDVLRNQLVDRNPLRFGTDSRRVS